MIKLIKHGTIIDGTGSPPVHEDLLIRGGRIVRRGSFPKLRANTVIDATGALVMPGFIDVGSAADAQGDLFTDHSQRSLLLGGVTTTIGGHCGWSLAPWHGAPLTISGERLSHPMHAPVVWNATKELFQFLEQVPQGINFGTLVGADTLRIAAHSVRNVAPTEDLSERDQGRFDSLLAAALADGVLGASVVYGGAHGAEERFLRSLATALASAHGVLSVHYAGAGDRMRADIHMLLEIVRQTRVSLRLSHFGPRMHTGSAYAESLAELEQAAGSCDVQLDTHPFDTTRVSLGEWRGPEKLTGSLVGNSPEFRALADHLPLGVVIERVFDQSLRFLEGKTIDALAATRGRTPLGMLLDVVRLTRGRASFLVKDVANDALESYLLSTRSLIATHGYEYRSGGAHATFLRWAAAHSPQLPLEAAVHRVTELAARAYRLRHRGTLTEGAAADVVVADPKTFLPTHVFVNGVHAVADGRATDLRGGRPLRRNRL